MTGSPVFYIVQYKIQCYMLELGLYFLLSLSGDESSECDTEMSDIGDTGAVIRCHVHHYTDNTSCVINTGQPQSLANSGTLLFLVKMPTDRQYLPDRA